jgi:hypothetical protein
VVADKQFAVTRFLRLHIEGPTTGPKNEMHLGETAEMIRQIFIALMLLSVTVALVAWYSADSVLDVQVIKASTAQ